MGKLRSRDTFLKDPFCGLDHAKPDILAMKNKLTLRRYLVDTTCRQGEYPDDLRNG
jgi:hypothetical protein